jgi:hypothetical protein
MTRKDFYLIANAVKKLRTFEAQDVECSENVARVVRFSSVVDALASALATTNPRFNRQRFVDACEPCDPLQAAKEAIKREDDVCFDVAAEHGQQFANVRHMTWYVEAVAAEL